MVHLVNYTQVRDVVVEGLKSMIIAEPEVTKYDTLVGDGDCGLCLKAGAEAVLLSLESSSTSDAVQLVANIAHVVEKSMDGTSGALYAIYINAMAHALREQDSKQPQPVTKAIWAKALEVALQALGRYTPAKPGDRTVVDTLQPFIEVFKSTEDLAKAVNAAERGCDSTKGMEASLGRSVYVGGEEWKNCPDPGAYGLLRFLKALVQ